MLVHCTVEKPMEPGYIWSMEWEPPDGNHDLISACVDWFVATGWEQMELLSPQRAISKLLSIPVWWGSLCGIYQSWFWISRLVADDVFTSRRGVNLGSSGSLSGLSRAPSFHSEPQWDESSQCLPGRSSGAEGGGSRIRWVGANPLGEGVPTCHFAKFAENPPTERSFINSLQCIYWDVRQFFMLVLESNRIIAKKKKKTKLQWTRLRDKTSLQHITRLDSTPKISARNPQPS